MKLFLDGKIHPLHEAYVQHLGGIRPEDGWESRGLSGHNLQRDEFDKLTQQSRQGFNELVIDKPRFKATMDRLMSLYQSLKAGGTIPEAAGLNHPEIHLVIGFMRTGGTYLFKQLMESCGLDHHRFLQKMTHDSLPSYHLCVTEFAQSHALELSLELAEYCQWLQDCWPQDTPLIQKRIGYGHDIPRFNTLFGGQPHWWVTLRDPSWAIDSFFKMENMDPNNNQHFPPFWQMAVSRFGEQSAEEWMQKPNYQKALDGWSMYHLDMFRGLASLDPSRYTFIPFERTAEMADAGPKSLDFSGFNYSDKPRPDYFDAKVQNQAIDRVLKGIDPKFHAQLEAYRA
ncbi:hypothetical protein [Saccharospirillum mangrovi]|uniref:hypothetical protein n=1 Tax=Saccharospirillum mangrovi TaxID=2161747 RepID=UPI000D3941E0|nr:hypothetical protein [Saccharospirillum mangrovi]